MTEPMIDQLNEAQSIAAFSQQAYLDYSMYVVLDRALPHVADGLKPVQRRIVYAMSELGLSATAKHKKSARTVGDVLGKYHPHGDSACYEAMVLMAQPFSYRYPLIDGQGNWGSADDPKSFAAMRYTESRLTPYAKSLLTDIRSGTTDWKPNFDGSLEEPSLLPARLPNVLLNGGAGIAVGMATDIPPHNLCEVVNACVALLKEPKSTTADLMRHMPGPDFPTAAEIITPSEELEAIYQSGRGSIRHRAVVERSGDELVVTALPYQVSGAKVLEQIANQMRAKKLPTVVDLRDESDHENPCRLVLVLKSSRVDPEPLLSHLYATTDLERSVRVNLNMIGIDGRPGVRGLTTILSEWLTIRLQLLRRRLRHRLDHIEARAHILAGLLVAYVNLDEVIAIIRHEDEPQQVMKQRWDLSDLQVSAICDIRLRQLAKLEEVAILKEQQALHDEREALTTLLASERRLKTRCIQELQEDAKHYGDERRSPLVKREEAQAMVPTELISAEAVTVVLSRSGWVRAGKGHEVAGETLTYRSGDAFLAQACGRQNQTAVFFDSTGKTYAAAAHELPSLRGQGDPLTARFNPIAGSTFTAVLLADPEAMFCVATDQGYGFLAQYEHMITRNKAGKSFLTVPEGASILPPQRIEAQHQQLAVITSAGRLLVFALADLPQLAKGKGNKLIQIPADARASGEELCRFICPIGPEQSLLLMAGKRHFCLSPKQWSAFEAPRGRRGSLLPRGLQRVERVLAQD